MTTTTFRRLLRAAACAVLALAAGTAAAQSEPAAGPAPAPVQLAGTLLKARQTGTIAIGYRDASVPFSYLSSRGEPIGYAIELCRALVAAVGEAVDRELAIRWVPVTPGTRVEAVVDGRIDLECGSTTNNLERRRRAAFSPTYFVAGTKLMVKTGSPIRSFRDLAGRKVAVTAGTTNEQTMRDLSKRFGLGLTLVVSPDHEASFQKVAHGEADAFATDDVLLHGLIASKRARNAYQVVGDFLSYDPYGVMYRKDEPQLAAIVNATFHALAADGEIERQYTRWFLRRLPLGVSLDLPMSAQLETILSTMAVAPE